MVLLLSLTSRLWWRAPTFSTTATWKQYLFTVGKVQGLLPPGRTQPSHCRTHPSPKRAVIRFRTPAALTVIPLDPTVETVGMPFPRLTPGPAFSMVMSWGHGAMNRLTGITRAHAIIGMLRKIGTSLGLAIEIETATWTGESGSGSGNELAAGVTTLDGGTASEMTEGGGAGTGVTGRATEAGPSRLRTGAGPSLAAFLTHRMAVVMVTSVHSDIPKKNDMYFSSACTHATLTLTLKVSR